MKKLYLIILSALLITGCSKDFLKKYDRRIEGTWQLTDVDRQGIGGSTGHLAFTEGRFQFEDDGTLIYTNNTGTVYKGTWDIKKDRLRDDQVHTLLITAVDFASQDVKSEHFDEIRFTSTNRFKGFIYSNSHAYVFRFKRQ